MKRIGIYALTAALLLSSCQSSDQFSAAAGGGLLGGIFGSAIGGLMGGPRGSDAGTVIGVIAGAAAGAASASPEVRQQQGRNNSHSPYGKRGTYTNTSTTQQANELNREYSNLEICNLRFVDPNNNQAIDANENSKIVFEIKNNGPSTIYDVAPVISVNGTKHIAISPTAIVSYIAAGQSVRYSAEVYGNKRLRDGMADFTISFAKKNYLYTMTTFQLATRARRK